MPIIKQDKSEKAIKFKFSLKPSLLNEIKDYCKWANINNDIETFFEQAADFVLKKDSEWKKYKKSKK
jgi:hypothetical protein